MGWDHSSPPIIKMNLSIHWGKSSCSLQPPEMMMKHSITEESAREEDRSITSVKPVTRTSALARHNLRNAMINTQAR